jgi:hypothetical protein
MTYLSGARYKRAEGLLIRSNAGALKPNHVAVANHECIIGGSSLLSRISDGISARVREANRGDLEQLLRERRPQKGRLERGMRRAGDQAQPRCKWTIPLPAGHILELHGAESPAAVSPAH